MFFARDGWKKEGKGFNRGNQRPANCPSLLSNLISKLREKSPNFRPGSYEPLLLHFVVYIDQIGIVYVPVGKILLVSTFYIAISRQLNGKQEFRDRLERGVTIFSKEEKKVRSVENGFNYPIVTIISFINRGESFRGKEVWPTIGEMGGDSKVARSRLPRQLPKSN